MRKNLYINIYLQVDDLEDIFINYVCGGERKKTKKGKLKLKKTATKKNSTPLEEWEQEKVFQWIRANQIRYPKLQLAYGTLNGVRLAPKLRKKMYLQGNRKGVPDIVLPAKSEHDAFSGLYIELKRVKLGKVSDDQKRYIGLLRDQGYLGIVCYGHVDAIKTIMIYLGVKG
ncbi:MAG: hypothetical protein GY710_14015 [Desulfobacteraceae bacterium]|nr:hypothetical protein [Desulfobacteraceae bacterium]